jgi:hypothetical protein
MLGSTEAVRQTRGHLRLVGDEDEATPISLEPLPAFLPEAEAEIVLIERLGMFGNRLDPGCCLARDVRTLIGRLECRVLARRSR